MNDVFISYSRSNKVFVQKLYDRLTAANRTVWADWNAIPAASDWSAEIKQGIQESDSIVFVLSPEWIKSNECRKELIHAVEMGKRLFPILYIPVDTKDVPPELAKINWVYMRDTDDFAKGFQTLCSAMDTDLEWIKTHTRIQVRAVEWEKKKRDHSFVLRGNDLLEGEQFIAGAANKTPTPTALQSEYILASRTDATRRQRQTLAGITVALVVSIILGVVALFQRKEAKDQAQIALARQLAAQAQLLNTNKSSKQLTASLLNIQSMKLFPNGDAASFLVDQSFDTKPVVTIQPGGEIESITYSPDGHYIASTVCDSKQTGNCIWSLRVWDAKSGKQVLYFTNNNEYWYSFVFTPDSRYIVLEECDLGDENTSSCIKKHLAVVETTTGRQLNSIDTSGTDSFKLSPDGKSIVVQSDKQKIVVFWDTFSGKKLAQIDYEGAAILSPDLKYMAKLECSQLGSDGLCSQRTIDVHELPSNKVVSYVEAIYEDSTFVFSPNGRYMAASGGVGTMIWETATGKMMYRKSLSFAGRPVVHLIFSPSDELVIAIKGETASVWDAATGNEISSFADTVDFNWTVLFSADEKYALIGNLSGVFNVWDLTTGVKTELPHDAEDFILSASFSPNGKYVVSAGDDGTARVLENATGKEIVRMTHNNKVRTAIFSPDGNFVASSGYDGTVLIWKPTRSSLLSREIQGSYGAMKEQRLIISTCLEYNEEGICTGAAILTRDISSGEEISRIPIQHYIEAMSADGSFGASRTCLKTNDNLQCIESSLEISVLATGKEVVSIHQEGEISTGDILFSPQGNLFAYRDLQSSDIFVLASDGTSKPLRMAIPVDDVTLTDLEAAQIIAFTDDEKYIIVTRQGTGSTGESASLVYALNTSTGEEMSHFKIGSTIRSFAVSPNSRYVVFGREDDATVWELATGKEISNFVHDQVTDFSYKRTYGVLSVAFSPDGKRVFTGSGDHTARVWEITTGKEITRMTHDDVVVKVAVRPDGKFVASISWDDVLRIWEISTGREVFRSKVYVYIQPIQVLSFSPDGKYIITDSSVIDWQAESIINAACAAMPRNLTRTEWKQYIGDAMSYQAVCDNLQIQPWATTTPTP